MRQPRHRRALPAPGPGPRRVRAAVAVVVLSVVAVLGTVLAGAPTAAAATGCSGPLADGQIRVVLVVDPGETGPRGPLATCLVVQAGTSGSKILAQRAAQLGLPAPRYAASGLLCGLDGFPASGCPVNNGGSYAYWAYFNGVGGGWSYGHDNPFVRRMGDGEIMGWRYTAGSPDGAAPAPRLAPSASLFPPLTPATTAPPAPPPAAAGGASGGAPAAGGGAPAVPDLSGLGGLAGDGATTTVPGEGEAAPASSGADGSSDTTMAADGTDAGGGSDAGEVAGALDADPASATSGGAGRWLGPAVAVAAAGALGVGAVTRSRRRSRAGT